MSKTYLVIIGVLLVIVLALGTFAFYQKSVSPANKPLPQTPTANESPIQPAPAPIPPVTPAQNQIFLTVSSPKTGQQVSTPTIAVTGKTVANADVSVNDKDVKAGPQGDFSVTITLDEGENDILVFASDDTGNYSEWNGVVTYSPSP